MRAVEIPHEMGSEEPPADPDDWTDEQWIEWLEKTDPAAADPAAADTPTRPVTAFGRIAHSSGGSVLGQAMLGMAAAIYGREQNEIVIMAEDSSHKDGDEPFTVHLDPEHPERSVVVVRSQGPPRSAEEEPRVEPDR